MKFGLRHYNRPTPKRLKQLGDALLAVNGFLATLTLMEGWSKWITLASVITGVGGKFLTKFFATEEKKKKHMSTTRNVTIKVEEVIDGEPVVTQEEFTVTDGVMSEEMDAWVSEHVGDRPTDRT